jgi:hypothetical protein
LSAVFCAVSTVTQSTRGELERVSVAEDGDATTVSAGLDLLPPDPSHTRGTFPGAAEGEARQPPDHEGRMGS